MPVSEVISMLEEMKREISRELIEDEKYGDIAHADNVNSVIQAKIDKLKQ